MLNRIFAIVCFLILAGCTTAPAISPNSGKITKGSKIEKTAAGLPIQDKNGQRRN